MTYGELKAKFRKHEEEHQNEHLTGFIVFTADSFDKEYSRESRTYRVSSDNKAFRPNCGGYSIFAACIDGTDPYVRLEQYMSAECGGDNGWEVEDCYMNEA